MIGPGAVLFDPFGNPLSPSSSMAAPARPDVAKNLPNSVADVHVAPPGEWETMLRHINPKTDQHSWLLFYWYRLEERWVLYDCVPDVLIDPKQQLAIGFSGKDFFSLVNGAREDLEHKQPGHAQYISQVQWEMYRLHRVYAKPYWVLEGEFGGHQVAFTPSQREHLVKMGLNPSPPTIGSLPACPFDNRVMDQLSRMNRLYRLHGSLDQLRRSGTSEAWDVEMAIQEREIRSVSMQLLEQQFGELGEMVHAMGGRKDTSDQVIHTPGLAAKAKDALAQYLETGEYTLEVPSPEFAS